MRKDIEILSQTFERIIDRKDAIIKSLVKDSEEAEEQFQVALRSHIQNIDKLIGMYNILSFAQKKKHCVLIMKKNFNMLISTELIEF